MDTLTKPKLIKARKGHTCDTCLAQLNILEKIYKVKTLSYVKDKYIIGDRLHG